MYWLYKTAAILVGSLLVAIGVNLFLVPHRLLEGGMIGIGLLATYYLQLPTGLIIICASLPVFILVFILDRRLFFHSFFGMVISSWFIDTLSVLRPFNVWTTASSAVFGGSMIGTGVGLMLAYETNTGGTDLLAQFFARRYKLPVALLILGIDGIIVGGSLQAVGIERMVFSLVTIIAVAATTHRFSKIRPPLTPYTIIGPLHSIQAKRAFGKLAPTERDAFEASTGRVKPRTEKGWGKKWRN